MANLEDHFGPPWGDLWKSREGAVAFGGVRSWDTLGAIWDITQFRDPIGQVNVAEPPCLSTKDGLPELKTGTGTRPRNPRNGCHDPPLGTSPTRVGGQDDVSSQANSLKLVYGCVLISFVIPDPMTRIWLPQYL